MKISPSILAADFLKLEVEVNRLKKAGADLLHFDIMDGHYVPNLTFGIPIIKKIREICSLPFDIHLMVTNPDNYIQELASLDVDYISWHPETVYHNHRLIEKIKSYGIKAGWALNPATPVNITDSVYIDLDFVLLMSVNPGFSGQSFLPIVYDKIAKIIDLNRQRQIPLEIQVDGGVNADNAPLLAQAGADILVAGSFILNNPDYYKAVTALRPIYRG